MMEIDKDLIENLYNTLESKIKDRVNVVIDRIVHAKEGGGKVVVVTGSGPNIHEGINVLIAELVRKNIVDGIITSSAVVAHEMAGSLDKVKRVNGIELGIRDDILPRGAIFEITMLDEDTLSVLKKEIIIDIELIERAMKSQGEIIIKAAGNMGYPVGLRTEKVAIEIEAIARALGKSFEFIAGLGSDERTIIGACARKNVPAIVSVPQLIGGGMVGICIGDSITLKQRSRIIADVLQSASIIIESGIALSQEIHDGPFETFTGHGIWSAWERNRTFSLKNKTLVRIDLDPNLERVWKLERDEGVVQLSINKGLPKTKTMKVPFRMEMSGFARLDGSIPIVSDIGKLWPVLALKVSERLCVNLDFISYPQETERGKQMREWIVKNLKILDMQKLKNETVKMQWN